MSKLQRKLPWDMASNLWPATLDPVIANALINGQQIDSIVLVSGKPNIINHSLGQLPQGFFLVDKSAFGDVIRTQPFNTKTITLEANANTTVSIWIY